LKNGSRGQREFKIPDRPITKLPNLFLDPALVRARDAHVFAVFGHRAAGHLDTLRLQDAGDLLISQRTAGVFFFNELLDAALEDQQ
jgi:hypothetical protein